MSSGVVGWTLSLFLSDDAAAAADAVPAAASWTILLVVFMLIIVWLAMCGICAVRGRAPFRAGGWQ